MDDSIFLYEKQAELSKWLKVISEPKRLMLLEKIIAGVQCNCELGDSLQMAPNLTSHHLSVLRESGLINAERDTVDGRWIYYSINLKALDEMKKMINSFFDEQRIQPRNATCGPKMDEKEIQADLSIRK